MIRVKQPVVHKNGIINQYYLKDKELIALSSCQIDPRIYRDGDEIPNDMKSEKEFFMRETLPDGFVFLSSRLS